MGMDNTTEQEGFITKNRIARAVKLADCFIKNGDTADILNGLDEDEWVDAAREAGITIPSPSTRLIAIALVVAYRRGRADLPMIPRPDDIDVIRADALADHSAELIQIGGEWRRLHSGHRAYYVTILDHYGNGDEYHESDCAGGYTDVGCGNDHHYGDSGDGYWATVLASGAVVKNDDLDDLQSDVEMSL